MLRMLGRIWLGVGCLLCICSPAFAILCDSGKTPPVAAPVTAASNAFSFRLYQQLSQQDLNSNLFISPLSVSIALAMTYNGANGQTKDEMAKTLGWQALTLPQLNTGFQSLDKLLQPAGGHATVELANELVVQQKFHLLPDFVQRCKDSFHAGLDTADFIKHEPAARKKINGWVGQKTHGKITDLLQDPLDHLTRLVLVNAVYFKDDWQYIFDKSHTREFPFTVATGSRKKVPMMEQSGKYDYFETDTLQAIRLPYKENGMSMEIYLPARNIALKAFVKQLTATQWQSWQQQLHLREGTIRLPRFQADYQPGLDLKGALKNMGMRRAFGDGADFARMTGKADLKIAHIFHRCKLEVNEKGTVAAAATVVVMKLKSAAKRTSRFDMTVDHPFFFVIRSQDGTILFMGSIADPQPLS